MTDIDYMRIAYNLALKGKGYTSPNPMVGAVLVKNGRILAKGWHRRCGGAHAEIAALKEAGPRAGGARLYVTLEPCFHFGKTPPCVDAIIKSKIKEIIIGMKDPNPLTRGKSMAKLRKAGIETKVGFLKKELEHMNEAFIKYMKHKIPFVVAKTAQTLDGKIATAKGQSKWITSKRARDYARGLRNDFDAILVGINTVLRDNPGLNAARKSKRIKKIILDSALRISPRAKLFQNTMSCDCIIVTTPKADQRKVKLLRKKGVNVIVCQARSAIDGIPIKRLLNELAIREITSILWEGGARVIGSALKERVVDKMVMFVAPGIMGDQGALSSIGGLKISRLGQMIKLRDMRVKMIGQDFFIEGYVKYPRS